MNNTHAHTKNFERINLSNYECLSPPEFCKKCWFGINERCPYREKKQTQYLKQRQVQANFSIINQLKNKKDALSSLRRALAFYRVYCLNVPVSEIVMSTDCSVSTYRRYVGQAALYLYPEIFPILESKP